mgnify:FL=1
MRIEKAESMEIAISHLEKATTAIRDIVDEQSAQLQEILEKLEALSADVKDFAEQMDETVYRMNRDRYGYQGDPD